MEEEEDDDDGELVAESTKLDDGATDIKEVIKINLPSTGKWRKFLELARSEKPAERREGICFAATELVVTARDLYVLYPDEIGNPDENLAQSLNNICELCHIGGLIGLGCSDKAIVLWVRVELKSAKGPYIPTQKETIHAVTRFYELCKIFNDFEKQHGIAKTAKPVTDQKEEEADQDVVIHDLVTTAGTSATYSKVNSTVIKRRRI